MSIRLPNGLDQLSEPMRDKHDRETEPVRSHLGPDDLSSCQNPRDLSRWPASPRATFPTTLCVASTPHSAEKAGAGTVRLDVPTLVAVRDGPRRLGKKVRAAAHLVLQLTPGFSPMPAFAVARSTAPYSNYVTLAVTSRHRSTYSPQDAVDGRPGRVLRHRISPPWRHSANGEEDVAVARHRNLCGCGCGCGCGDPASGTSYKSHRCLSLPLGRWARLALGWARQGSFAARL
ncbi:uncharacterized protein PFL1_06314 [Pseudozyma flocculosa PF-1]|uniref:Uncharacterized protein n=1 Tax=Pseudozyma flocculosa PF-1 TaxID=1277687 RepID=A0A061H688_9BASI|nr:uncharacterized protein PFL1_06314 [Pseudozyma flocculosa PF-1]EPQ26106.1 hypothetical protein PFL1_06314 [Pseudozyma flocculosa PF-1]